MSIGKHNARLRPRIETLEDRDVPALVNPLSTVPLNVPAASSGHSGAATITNQATNGGQAAGGMTVVSNPVTTTADAAGNDVIVTGGGTADNGSNNGPLTATATQATTVQGTTVRARTPFEIRGSRTSLTQYTASTTFTGVPPIDPGSTPAPTAP